MPKIFPTGSFRKNVSLTLMTATIAFGCFFITGSALAASDTTVTTNEVMDLTVDSATQGATKVPVLSFTLSNTNSTTDKFKSMLAHYTGTNRNDIAKVYLYKESGTIAGSNFDAASDTLLDSATSISSANEATLDPTDFAFSQAKFYIVVDIDSAANVGDTVDFDVVADKISFTNGTWPSAADITANGWNPAGSTSILSSVTTDEVAQVGPVSALQGATKVAITSFTLSNTDAANKFQTMKVRWTGTAASPSTDIGNVYLYKESGTIAGSSFSSGSDTLKDTTAAGAGTEIILNPTDFTLDSQTKFYVVADIKAGATLGHAIDFKIEAGKITLTSGTWPPASEITAGTWNPSGSTLVKSNQSITVTTHAPASAIYGSSFPVAATATTSSLTVAMTTTGGCSISGGTVTMTSATDACVVHYNQSGNGSYNAAAEITESTTAQTKTLTVTGVTASHKVYNGNTGATLNTASTAFVGVVGSDVVTLDATSATGTFVNKNIGIGKTVTVSGLALGGANAGNYTLTQPTTTANITVATLTVSGVTANTRAYDATTAATLNVGGATLVGVINPDVVTLAGIATGVFADINVGNTKTVTISGFTITGAGAGNYVLTQPTATADITTAALTITAQTNTKIYDKTMSAAATPIASGRQGSDTVTGLAETYDTANVGTNKILSVSAYTVNDGNGGLNYTVSLVTNTTGEITARAISVTAATDSRVYNGTTNSSAVPAITSGALQGLDTPNFTQTYNTKDVGATKTLTATGSVTDGNGGANYAVTFVTNSTGVITPFALTGSITAANKVYDATDAATISGHSVSGVIGLDIVTYTGGTATFDTKNVGTVKTVTGTGLSLLGADAGNYTVNATAVTTANITALAITGSITADNKIYDRNNSATIATRNLNGVVSGDVVTVSGGTATFNNENVGTNKVVSATGLTLGGGDAGNYSYDGTAATTANITKKDLIVSATGINKIYDGNINATATLTTDALLGDVVTATDTAAFEDKNVGTIKPVHVTGISISGGDAGNYNLTNTTADTTADITPRALTVSATADSKTYDGTTDAVAHLTTDKVLGDAVTPAYAAATFANKNIGIAKTVSVSGITISGADASNYTFNTSTNATADINALAITGHITANTKVYDGTDTATILTRNLVGQVVSDDVSYIGGTATFDTKNVGTGKTVTGTGLSLSGADAGNYTVNTSADTTANITALLITVTAQTNTKTYDGTTSASSTPTITLGALAAGDTAGFIETYDNKNVGTGKTLTPSGIVSDGNGGANYGVTFANDTTGVIEMLALTLTADAKNKIYATSDPALTYQITSGSLVSGDSVTGTLTRAAGEDVGAYAITQGIVSAGTNYHITYIGANLTIGTADITVTADAQNKIYGDADPALTYQITSGALATGDSFTGALERAAGNNVGTYAITQGSLALGTNYNLTYAGANLTINKATPVITWDNPANITYPVPLSVTELNASSSVAGIFTYNPILGTVLSAGPHQLAVDFVPTDAINYNDASTTVLITVIKGTPVITWANPAGMVAGTALGGTELNAVEASSIPGSFVYNPVSGTVFTVAGSHALHVDFTPDHPENYNNAHKDVAVNVVPAEIVALNLVASPTSLAFDQTSEITVTGKDQYGNTVTNNNSTVAVLSADGGGSLVDTLLTLTAGVASTHLSKDSAGNVHVTVSSGVLSPAQTTVTFTQTDTSSPFVESHTPLNGATGVALTVHPTLTFSEALNAVTVNSTHVQLRKVSDDSVIPATVSMAEGVRKVIITPDSALDFGTNYYFAVSADVTDMAGNPALVLDSTTKGSHTFTTVTDTTVLAVTQISAVNTFATADNTFDNGWKWTFDITVPTAETQLQMKFADWIGTAGSIAAANNIRYYSAQSGNATDGATAMTITAADTYAGSLDLNQDLDTSHAGRQVQVTVEARVPTGSAGGSYSTSYGVHSN